VNTLPCTTRHHASTIPLIDPAVIARNNLHHATPQVFNLIFKPRRVGALDAPIFFFRIRVRTLTFRTMGQKRRINSLQKPPLFFRKRHSAQHAHKSRARTHTRTLTRTERASRDNREREREREKKKTRAKRCVSSSFLLFFFSVRACFQVDRVFRVGEN
jgi:hypothetical protein